MEKTVNQECLFDLKTEVEEMPEEMPEERPGIDLAMESIEEILGEIYPGLMDTKKIFRMVLNDVRTALEYWLKDEE